FVGESDVTRKHASDRPVSMIFQDHNLFAHLTVEQNVGLGISPGLALRQDDKQRIAEALKSVGLDGYGNRKPSRLSGGERQRVALARILVRDRPILLMDEALASLGPGLRQSILDLVRQLQTAKKLTVIMVTHDPTDALRIADDVVFLADRQVIGHGAAEDILRKPSDTRISAYLGSA
ncbi:MAG: ATP-binding cassette domain-containing protein, partial [Pseudomonadota bacterium]